MSPKFLVTFAGVAFLGLFFERRFVRLIGSVLRGNFIGVNENGTAAIPNDQTGVLVEGAANTTVGGTQA